MSTFDANSSRLEVVSVSNDFEQFEHVRISSNTYEYVWSTMGQHPTPLNHNGAHAPPAAHHQHTNTTNPQGAAAPQEHTYMGTNTTTPRPTDTTHTHSGLDTCSQGRVRNTVFFLN